MIKVGINGFGRIGSLAFRAAIKSDDIEVVAINAPGHPATHIAYCVKYDSVHGRFDGEVVGNDEDSTVTVNGKVVASLRQGKDQDHTEIVDTNGNLIGSAVYSSRGWDYFDKYGNPAGTAT